MIRRGKCRTSKTNHHLHPPPLLSGTKIQVCAWDHASDAVKQQIEQLGGFDRCILHSQLAALLSVADVLVLDHAFGVGFATKFVAEVDLWVYADEQTKAAIGVKSYVQSTLKNLVLQVRCLAHSLMSKTSYLMSPFLIKPKLRPALVRKSQSKAAPAAAAAAAPASDSDSAAAQTFSHVVFESFQLLPCSRVQFSKV